MNDLSATIEDLRDAPGTVEFPAAVAPADALGPCSAISLDLAREPVARLRAVAAALVVDPSDVVLASFVARLARSCGERDLVLGLVDEDAPGDGLVVIRPRIAPDLATRDATRAIARARRDASRAVSLRELDEALGRPSSDGRLGLVHAVFESRDAHVAVDELRGSGRPLAALELVCEWRGPTLRLLLSCTRVDPGFAKATLDALESSLHAFDAALDRAFGRLPVLSSSELALVESFSRRDATDTSRPWYVRVREHARATPDAVALVARGRTFTYAEVDATANRLANRLVARGVRSGDRVAIQCARSEWSYLSSLAAHRAGAVFVPIDPTYPRDRIRMIVEDSAPKVMVVDGSIHETDGLPASALLDVDDPSIADESPIEPGVVVDERALAYIIFTSGSTGRPKGVAIEHRALTNLLTSMAIAPGLTARDRMLGIVSFSFDMSIPDLTLPSFVGGSLEIADATMAIEVERLAEKLRDPAITLFQATPTTFRMLLDHGMPHRPDLRVGCGGEATTSELVDGLLPRIGELWNLYGPTETTVWSTAHRFHASSSRVSLGAPLRNTSVHVLDALGERVPVGCVGELVLGGHGVARGYFGRDDLTAARFVADPFSEEPDARMYRTGDLARILPDGTVDFLGRSDFQVKVRGHRIELGEIESVLLREPSISQCVVVAREDVPGDVRIVAYVVSQATDVVASARDALIAALPRYMLPSAFVVMDALPLTPALKIDRKALPPPGSDLDTEDELVVEDDVEASLRAIFRDLLRSGSFDRETSFFDAGGDSLLAVRLAKRIEESFGVRIDLARIFAGPTLRELALAIRGDGGAAAIPQVVELRRGPRANALFCICGVSLYQHLARAMPKDVSVYGIYLPIEGRLFDLGNLRNGRIEYAGVRRLAAMYVAAIRAVQPEGPYRVLGVSFGGVVAYEVARQLRADGATVALVGLLDALLPGSYGGSFVRRAASRLRDAVRNEVSRSSVRKLIAGRLARRRGGSRETFLDAELEFLRERVQELAVYRYTRTLPELDADVVLVEATDRSAFAGNAVDATFGWRDVIRGTRFTYGVDGDHLGILGPDHAHELAEILGRHLHGSAAS